MPEGHIIEERKGGYGVLADIIEICKARCVSGYIEVLYEDDRIASHGTILTNKGLPIGAFYRFIIEKDRIITTESYSGARAFDFILEDSESPTATLIIHADVDPALVEQKASGARIAYESLIMKWKSRSPLMSIDLGVLANDDSVAARKIKTWAQEGYDVSRVLDIYLSDPEKATLVIDHYEKNIDRARALLERLRVVKGEGIERELRSISKKAKDPDRVADAEMEFEFLVKRLETSEKEKLAERQIRLDVERKKQNERIDRVYDLIIQYHKMKSSGAASTARCPRCGEPLDRDGLCLKCGETVIQKPRYGRPINPQLTFSRFVVGHSNRFAEAAARGVANSPGTMYNPLFIYGRSGMGKTHLLHAIANEILSKSNKFIVLYTSMEKFEGELIEALATSAIDDFRRHYAGADVLLIDDVQFLAGRERMQEELFHVLSELIENRKQVVLACDRPPKDIPSISDRLITRFESGLIADIQQPEYETRVAILERKIREEGLSVPKEVLEFIADVCRNNIRQLHGGLNRVVAFSSLMNVNIDFNLAREVLSSEAAGLRISQTRFDLKGGHSYLLEESRPEGAYRAFVSKLQEGYSGMAITRGHPRNLMERMGELRATLYWLTDRESTTAQTLPPSLERIMLVIEEFIHSNEKSIILLDDIQYLISYTTFEGVIRFIRSVVDEISETQSIFLVSVSEESLRIQDRSILEREMEVIKLS
ncbi:MAG: DnaA/Hda family protein [Methanomassiliicoccales archaeon]